MKVVNKNKRIVELEKQLKAKSDLVEYYEKQHNPLGLVCGPNYVMYPVSKMKIVKASETNAGITGESAIFAITDLVHMISLYERTRILE